jgi:hypothetical protein
MTYYIEPPENPWDAIDAPHLWQGGCAANIPPGSFDYVLTMDAGVHRGWPVPDGTVGFLWDIPDAAVPNVKVLRQWATTVRDLALIANRRVLVRCQAGLNRSGLVVATVLVLHGMDPQEAIDTIRRRRSPYALCNERFAAWIIEEAAGLTEPTPA